MKIAILFDRFGPYHLARLEAASHVCTLLAVEITQKSLEYAWTPSRRPPPFRWARVDPINPAKHCRLYHRTWRLRRDLSQFKPDCVFIPGWSRSYSWAALGWCVAKGVPAVVMSESTERDVPHSAWKEHLKTWILAHCSAALVGGVAHADYLYRLGMPRSSIFEGYDAVDNEYFRRTTRKVRERDALLRLKFALPTRYFLASARFVAKKNLPGLVTAYAEYRTLAERSGDLQCPWSLVILGDGPQAGQLRGLISALGLQRVVFLPGFKQYPDLPVYYGLAGAFVHASISEPWGLVVNEAMASGLPVLVSNRCGCARDLVRNEINGFTFDPNNIRECAGLMLRCSSSGPSLAAMSRASLELISAWGPSRFSEGVQGAAEMAVQRHSTLTTRVASLFLNLWKR